MKRWLLFIDDKFEELFLVSTLFFSVALIFAQVVMRYVFKNSLSWSEEMARYLFVWQAWIAASFATQRSRHINLDIVTNLCSPKIREVLFWIAHIIWLGFALFLTWKAGGLALLVFSRKTISAAMQIRMGWVYLAVPVGCALMSYRLIQILAAKVKARPGIPREGAL